MKDGKRSNDNKSSEYALGIGSLCTDDNNETCLIIDNLIYSYLFFERRSE